VVLGQKLGYKLKYENQQVYFLMKIPRFIYDLFWGLKLKRMEEIKMANETMCIFFPLKIIAILSMTARRMMTSISWLD
jgi:hypothetical protein